MVKKVTLRENYRRRKLFAPTAKLFGGFVIDIYEVMATIMRTDENIVGEYINKVADEYRQGENLRTLIPLLTHSDSKFVSVGAWIASEAINENRGREIFDELSILLNHSDPAVRFGVIQSVALLVQPEEHSIIHRLFLLAVDPNPGVRRHALTYLCWIPDSLVQSLHNTNAWPIARLLISNTSKEEIRSAIKSKELFDQRMAVAAALRNYGNDKDFIQEILPLLDDEVTEKLPDLPKNRVFN